MAKDILSELVLQMTVENAAFKKELEKATAKQVAFEKQTEKSGKSLISFDKTMSIAAKSAAAFSVAMAAIGFSQQRQRDIENYARLTGVTSERFLNLAYAAKAVGIENEKLADISKDTLEKLGEFIATGGGGFKDFFENVAPLVGLTAKELQGLSGPDVLIAVKKAMDDANISMEEQSFYLESIASDTTALIPLLREEGKAFSEVAIESETLADAFSRLADEGARALTVLDEKSGVSNSIISFVDYLSSGVDHLLSGGNSIPFLNAEIKRLQKVASFQTKLGIDTTETKEEIKELQGQIDALKNSMSPEELLGDFDAGSQLFGQTTADRIWEGLESPEAVYKGQKSVSAYLNSVTTSLEMAKNPFETITDGIDFTLKNIEDEPIDWTKVISPETADVQVEKVKESMSGLTSFVTSNVVSNLQIVTSGLEQMGEESSDLLKFLFAIQKAAAIPAMIVNTNEAYTKALSLDPTGLLAETVRASGYAAVGVAAGQSIAGVFHGGGAVPSGNHEQTYLLKGGEYVESRAERRQIDNMLSNQQGEVNVNLSYNIQALDSKGVREILMEHNETVFASAQQAARKQGRRL